jgi:hypothetical protein
MDKNIYEAPSSVNSSLYQNTDFKDRVVGSSTPSKDKINPSLLADVDKAAKAAGVKVSVTTAVTGHRNSGRHPKGNAVDIAMVNGKGFSSLSAAKSNGIYDAINKFVNELVKMGYVKNSESGNDKAVLTFGFPNHDNHVHVSRNSDSGTSSSNPSLGSSDTPDDETKGDVSKDSETKDDESKTDEPEGEKSMGNPIFKSMLNLLGFKENDESLESVKPITEEIIRIKQLMK